MGYEPFRPQLPQILVEIAEFRSEHERQDSRRLRPAAQCLETMAAGRIGVGGNIEALATLGSRNAAR